MNKTASNGVKVRESNFELLRLLAIGLVIFPYFNLWSFGHENPFIRKLLWSGNFIPVSIESDILPFIGLACLKVSIIYVACLLFDRIRILLLGRLETRLSSAICRGMVFVYLRLPLRRHLKKMKKLL